jgi:hypothetical protein
MKQIVSALCFVILTAGGCSTPGGSTQAVRLELQPGYWDPK